MPRGLGLDPTNLVMMNPALLSAPVSSNEYNEETGEFENPSETAARKQDRQKDDKDKESTDPEKKTTSASDTIADPAKVAEDNVNGVGYVDEAGEMGGFLAGFNQALYGTATSEIAGDWGVTGNAYQDVMNDPDLMTTLFQQNNGKNAMFDAGDTGMFMDQVNLRYIMDPSSIGNPLDTQAALMQQWSQPGSNYMSMGDVMGVITQGGPGAEALAAMGTNDINGFILGSVIKSYPTPVLQAMKSTLDTAGKEYDAAVATGYNGTYIQFMGENGYIDYLGGM